MKKRKDIDLTEHALLAKDIYLKSSFDPWKTGFFKKQAC
jgi:hypothetical protein